MDGVQHASKRTRLVLGVDGGATKTACIAIDQATRQAVAQAAAGPSNWSSVGKEEALQALERAVSDTLAACSMTWDAVAAICLGMAGVDTPQDQAALTHAIRDWFPQDVDSDLGFQ